MRHHLVREGVITGVIGATAVALWFLIVDMLAARPLYTPAVLGNMVGSLFGGPATLEITAASVLGYTVLHYAAFILVGILAALVVHWAETFPPILALFLVLFVCLELAIYGLTALLAQFRPIGTLAWYQVLAGNLIAALLMGAYLWRRHPSLAHNLDFALDGKEH